MYTRANGKKTLTSEIAESRDTRDGPEEYSNGPQRLVMPISLKSSEDHL